MFTRRAVNTNWDVIMYQGLKKETPMETLNRARQEDLVNQGLRLKEQSQNHYIKEWTKIHSERATTELLQKTMRRLHAAFFLVVGLLLTLVAVYLVRTH